MTFYRKSSDAELKSTLTVALTSTKDERQLNRLIDLLSDTDTIRQQDTLYWYVDLLRNREGRVAAWKWMRSHWAWIDERFASDKSHDYFLR